MRILFIVFTLILAVSANADAVTTRVDQALNTDALTADEAVIILYNSVHNSSAVPSELIDGTIAEPCGTAAFDAMVRLYDSCSAPVRERLDALLARPSVGSPEYTDETDHFLIHWTDNGANATDQSYVDELKLAFEHSWTVEIDEMGYDVPPSDMGLGGSTKYDVYVMGLTGGTMGYCSTGGEFPDPTTPEADYSSHIVMTNNVAGFGIEALRETTSHEFQHGLQAGYEAAEPTWFKENCSVWIENEVWDYNGYTDYLGRSDENCLRQSWRDIRSPAMYWYGGSPWPMFMEVSTGTTDAVRMVWELCADTVGINMLGAIDGTARHYGKDFDSWLMDYACWRWFTGNLADDQHYELEECSLWCDPLVLPWNIVTMDELPILLTDSIYGPEALGMVWVSVDVAEYDGWINFDFDARDGWEWGIGVISTRDDGTDSYHIEKVSNPESTINFSFDATGWDDVILVIQNLTVSTFEGRYEFELSEVTGIEEGEGTATLALTPLTNPMSGNSAITVSLPTAGFSTLNIYDVSGRMIQNAHAGELPVGNSDISIDTDELGTGTYFARLIAPGGGCSSRFVVID